MKAVRDIIPDSTKVVTCMGNHEWYRHGWGVNIQKNPGFTEMYHELFEKCTGNAIENDIVCGGIHMIVVSSDDETDRISTREPYLTEHIRAAAAEDPSKPIFVAMHKAVKYTVISSYNPRTMDTAFLSQDFSDEFLDFLKNYPQVVFVSGHTHVSLRYPTSIHQKDYTSIQLGTMGGVPSTGFIFSISSDNIVKAYRINFTDGYIYDEPWVIDIPAAVKDKSSFRYTDARADALTPPEFEGEFKVIALDCDKIEFTHPIARDPDPTGDANSYAYIIRLYDVTNGRYIDVFDDDPEDCELPIDCYAYVIDVDRPRKTSRPVVFDSLTSDTDYRIELGTLSVYNDETEPIYFEFKTKKQA